jgi:prepilin-type N-terminal cleavage/methylation domain-containing protein
MNQRGVSLIETMIAMLVLTVGAIGMASVFLYGMQSATSSPNELVATQKATEAMESVIAARDSHTLTWAQLRNASDGGIFLNGAKTMKVAGADGILNTADDGAVETVQLPGADQLLGTDDDKSETLNGFTREITIADVSTSLRSITVTITYQAGSTSRTYTLTGYMSAFS